MDSEVKPSKYRPNLAWWSRKPGVWANDTDTEALQRIRRTPAYQIKCWSSVPAKKVKTFRPRLSFRRNTVLDDLDLDDESRAYPEVHKPESECAYCRPKPCSCGSAAMDILAED